MSPRAAWRLESWGYDAYDYVAGKMDWISFGLPHEGEAVLVGEALTRDVPSCGPGDPISAARVLLEGSGLGRIPVLNEAGVVLGAVDADAVAEGEGTVDDALSERTVDHVLSEGPTTVRPSEELEGLLHRMEHADVPAIFVTTSDGLFLGVLEMEAGRKVLDERG